MESANQIFNRLITQKDMIFGRIIGIDFPYMATIETRDLTKITQQGCLPLSHMRPDIEGPEPFSWETADSAYIQIPVLQFYDYMGIAGGQIGWRNFHYAGNRVGVGHSPAKQALVEGANWDTGEGLNKCYAVDFQPGLAAVGLNWEMFPVFVLCKDGFVQCRIRPYVGQPRGGGG